jgi:hypothetical protein
VDFPPLLPPAELLNPSHPLNQGRVAWWLTLPGLDGGRQWFDLCGLNHGTLTNMTTAASGWRGTTRPGGWGQLLFDKTVSSKVDCGTATTNPSLFISGTNALAVSLWYQPSQVALNNFLMSWGARSAEKFVVLDGNNGFPVVGASPNGAHANEVTVQAATASVVGAWNHVYAHYDPVAQQIGVRLNAGPLATASFTSGLFATTDNCIIGGQQNSAFYTGALDDISVWNRILSATEVKDLYDTSRRGYPSILLGSRLLPSCRPNLGTTSTTTYFLPSRPVDNANPVDDKHPLNRGLAAWYLTLPGLDGGNRFYDLLGLNPGTLTNMTTSSSGWRGTTRPGGRGNLLFDGTDDYVNCGEASFVPSSLTAACWFKASSLPGTTDLVSKFSSGGNQRSWQLTLTVSSVGVLLDSTGSGTTITNISTGGGTVTTGTWYHAAFTYDGSTLRLYLNGIEKNNVAFASGIFASTANILLGSQNAGGFGFLNGLLDDVEIYARSLSAAEVKALYDSSLLGHPGRLRLVGAPHDAVPLAEPADTLDRAGDAPQLPIDLTNPVNRSHSLNAGKVAWWLALPGLDGGGKLYDLLGFNTGALTNMTAASGWRGTTRPGGWGHLVMDGTDDRVAATPSGTVSGAYTVAVWTRPTVNQASQVFSSRRGSDFTFDLQYAGIGSAPTGGGGLHADIGTGSAWLTTAANVAYPFILGNWYHLAYAVTASGYAIYVNGVQVATGAFSGTPLLWDPAHGIDIGGQSTFFAGALDDTQVWARALSTAEVQALYQAGLQGYPGMLNRLGRLGVAAAAPESQLLQVSVRWQLVWKLLQAVGVADTALWGDRGTACLRDYLLWNDRAALNQFLCTPWNDRARVAKSPTSLWSLRTTASSRVAAPWTDLQLTHGTGALVWADRLRVGGGVSALWNERAAPAAIVAARWADLLALPVAPCCRWNAYSRIERAAALRWLTHAPGAHAPPDLVLELACAAGVDLSLVCAGELDLGLTAARLLELVLSTEGSLEL